MYIFSIFIINLFPASFRILLFKSLHMCLFTLEDRKLEKGGFWEFLSMYRAPDPEGIYQANVTHPFQNLAVLSIYTKTWVGSRWFSHPCYFSCWFVFVTYIVRKMKSGVWRGIVRGTFNSQVMRKEEFKKFFVCWMVPFTEQHCIVCEWRPLNIKTEPFCLVLLPWKMRRWIWKSKQEKPWRN